MGHWDWGLSLGLSIIVPCRGRGAGGGMGICGFGFRLAAGPVDKEEGVTHPMQHLVAQGR